MVHSRLRGSEIGASGLGIVISLCLMVACFFIGMKMSGSSDQSGQDAGAGLKSMMAEKMNVVPGVAVTTTAMSYVDKPTEYVGFVEAIESVGLRAQVGGTLAKVHFSEGSQVNKGDLLFTIDPRQYQATLDLRKAQLTQAQADLDQAQKYLKRLNAADGRSISQSDLDAAESAVLGGKARVQQAQASLVLAEIDLGYTKITAPVSGYIGRALVTEGNYVEPGKESLAQIVQIDPVRVVFSMSDRQYLSFLDRQGGSDGLDVKLITPDGAEFATLGTADFLDNQIDRATATVAIRFRFANPERRLLPGGYVTVQLSDSQRRQALIVPHSAVMNSASGSAVYVVDQQSKAQLRPVVTGIQTETGIVIESGLNEGEMIIVQGLQKVKPEGEVKVQE
ncbi:MAG: efflux RND transporter periplasmic adaptor subunit [Sedimentisphaerales bacterium]|nr:efflux RND transporter periplasmic adaptor subunit [Sedimentisphaerales bacterium]